MISPAPYELENYRRFPVHYVDFAVLPPIVADTSGGAVMVVTNPPFFRIGTGAVGANKTQELGFAKSAINAGDAASVDGFAIPADADARGFWERILILDCIVRHQGASAGCDASAYVGIGLGSYNGVGPPDPATTTDNVVRLVLQPFDASAQLIIHPGDGVSAQTKTPLLGAVMVTGRNHHLRIVYVPGEYVSASFDGVVGATVSANLPLLTPGAANPRAFTFFVCSGGTAVNVRGVFHGLKLETRGMQ